jgi:hypothetical protein
MMRILLASTALVAVMAAASLPASAQMSGSGMKSGSGMSGANMFCLKRAGDASPECGFKTMAQCEQSKTSQQDMCSHQAETKGMGSGGMNKGM